LVRGYKMPPMVFTPEEATALYLGTSLVEEMWGKLYRDASISALAKLDNVLPINQQAEIAWARRSLMVTHMHRTNISIQYPYLEILRMAMHDSKRVRMLYQSRTRPKPISREVDPYALIHRWGWWYMVGYCYLREAVRSFRVDRIREICLLEQEFTYPQDFNIHIYLETDVLSEQMQAVRMRFAAEAAPLIHADSTFWEKIDKQEDGTIITTIKTSDMNYAANLVMNFSPLAEVLEPVELRKKISQRLQTAIKHYQNDLKEEQNAK